MAYAGYLIKLRQGESRTFEITPDLIKLDSYSVTWNSQDYTAYRDCNGVLHRNALPTKIPKVEFYTRNQMTNTEFGELMKNIRSMYYRTDTGIKERRINAIIYVPELDSYVTTDVYLSDFTPSIYRIDGNTVYYNACRMALIGYGAEYEHEATE